MERQLSGVGVSKALDEIKASRVEHVTGDILSKGREAGCRKNLPCTKGQLPYGGSKNLKSTYSCTCCVRLTALTILPSRPFVSIRG